MDFVPPEPILPSLSDVVRWQGSQTACPALDSLILESEITVRPPKNITPRVSLFAEPPIASGSITPANTTRSSSRLRPRHSEPAAPPPTTSFLNPRLDIFEENGPTKFLNFVKVVSARVDENVNANAANGSGKTSSKRKQRSVSVSSLTAAGMLKKGRTDPMTVQPSSSLRNEVGWKGKSRALIRSASATTSGYDDDDYSLMDVDMSFGNGMDVDVPQAFLPPSQTKSASQIDMPPPPAPPVKPTLWGAESGELRTTRSSVASSSTTKPSPSVTGVATTSSSSRINTSSASTTQASSSTARSTSSASSTTSSLTRAGTRSSNSNFNSSSRTTTSLPPATPKSATVLPPPRTPTKSGLRSSSPRPSKTSAKGPNPNSNAVPSNEKGAPIQTRPPVQVQTRAAPAPAQTRPQPQVQTRPTGQTHIPPPSRPSPPIPPPSSSQRPPPSSSQHPPALGMRRTHTLPLPPASQSGELPSRQRRFKPPLLGANGNQGSASQGMRNGAGGGVKNGTSVGGGSARNVSSPVTTGNAPPAPPPSSLSSSNGDSPQRGGGYRSSPSSADDSDVCVTPGVSVSHGLGVQAQAQAQVRHDSSGSNPKSISSHAGVSSKSMNAKCAQPDKKENDDASLLMVEDDPNDSSFGDIDMSFDMDALEETMKMYD